MNKIQESAEWLDPSARHGPRRGTMTPARSVIGYWEPALPVTVLLLAFTVARYIVLGARRDWLATLRLEFWMGLALGGACILLFVRNRFSYRSALLVFASLVLLFLMMVMQLPLAADPEAAQFIMSERVLKFAVLPLYLVVLVHSPRTFRWFLLAYLFSCFYVTQESVRGLISGGLVWENQGVMRLHGAVRMYAHPNSLAGLAIGALPFIVFLWPHFKDKRIRAGFLLTLGTAMICIIYSGSRTSYVGFLSLMIFWWAVSRHKKRFLIIAAGAFLIALPLLPDQYIERFKSIGGEEAEGSSKERRIEILEDAWQIFLEHPFGVGPASFPKVRNERFGRHQDTHNLYLEVATNLGIQGFAVFCVMIWSFIATCVRAFADFSSQLHLLQPILSQRASSQCRDPDLSRMVDDLRFLQGAVKAIMGFLVVRLVLGLFGMDLFEPYWWFVGGVSMNLAMLSRWTKRNCRRLVDKYSLTNVPCLE